MLRNNYRSCNLIGHYHFWGISPRNSTLFTRPFLTGRHARAGHETKCPFTQHLMVWLPHHDVVHLLKNSGLEVTLEDVVSKKARKLTANCFILLPPSFHCKQLWDLQLQKIHHQVPSLVIVTVMLCHRLQKVQEVVVAVCTTKPGCVGVDWEGA